MNLLLGMQNYSYLLTFNNLSTTTKDHFRYHHRHEYYIIVGSGLGDTAKAIYNNLKYNIALFY